MPVIHVPTKTDARACEAAWRLLCDLLRRRIAEKASCPTA